MFSKTTLSAAIAVALSMGIGTAAQAGTGGLSDVTFFNQCTSDIGATTGSCAAPANTLAYAYEQFGTEEVDLKFPFKVLYRPTTTKLGNGYSFYVNFTLSGGATWKGGLTTGNLTIPTATTVPVAIVAKGSSKDSTVSYRVDTTTALTTDQLLYFTFYLNNVQKALKTPGGQITLSVEFKVAQSADPTGSGNKAADTNPGTVSLASSVQGADLKFEYTETAKAYINVETDGKTFIGSGKISDTSVDYGLVKLWNMYALHQDSLSAQGGVFTTYTSGVKPWPPEIETFKLSIDTGNFAASGVPSDGKVYIDLKGKKLNASTISADKLTATWDYNSTADPGLTLLPDLIDADRTIMLTVNGTDSINESRKAPPKGTLSIGYKDGGSVTRTATLRHLKRNGTVCTLYNIPNSDALDLVHLRITNDSAGTAGFVKGTLRNMDGTNVFKGKTLIDVGGLVPHQTIHLGMADLTSNGEKWGGRGVLTLESNIPEPYMQVYALLRAAGLPDEFPESPLMNLSTGASGNGCD